MATSVDFRPRVSNEFTVTIANGATTSGAVDLVDQALAGIYMPGTFTGTTLKIQAAPTADGTFVTVTDAAGSDFSVTVAASKYIPIANLAITAGLRHIKLVSGSSEGGSRTLTLATRPV